MQSATAEAMDRVDRTAGSSTARAVGGMAATADATGGSAGEALTKSQIERRARVIRAALELAAKGGYDTVQMRDVAAQAGVALGTVYRYFPSKDALLAAATVEWMADLEALLLVYPPRGASTPARIMDVLDRVLRLVDREPQRARAFISALTAGDAAAGAALSAITQTFARILSPAFPAGIAPARCDAVARVLGHVLWSTLMCWADRIGDMSWVAGQLEEATQLLVGEGADATAG